mgnify:CR=1 FL=1
MVDPQAATGAAKRGDSRRSRQSRLLKAELLTRRLGKFTATVRNVSEQGIGGKAPHELNLGERVQITLPGLLPLVGTVRWTFEGQFGIETDKSIALDALRTAYGNNLPGGNQSAFPIQRPPQTPAKRPALGSIGAPFGQGSAVDDHWLR